MLDQVVGLVVLILDIFCLEFGVAVLLHGRVFVGGGFEALFANNAVFRLVGSGQRHFHLEFQGVELVAWQDPDLRRLDRLLRSCCC